MKPFEVAAGLVILGALCSYINFRFIHLPAKIGAMAIALGLSLILVGADALGAPLFRQEAAAIVSEVQLPRLLLDGVLAFLLFAAALDVNLADLKEQLAPVVMLATVGVVISTIVVGASMWLVLHSLGNKVPLVRTLLFGALISPTDPIAITGILRNVSAPKALEVQMSGESLFNDGVGIVVFTALWRAETTGAGVTAGHLFGLFAREAFGGLALGIAAGFVVYRMLRGIENYEIEIMLTLALAMGAYAAAERLQFSGPVTAATAGLVIGNQGRSYAMSDRTKKRLDSFWEVMDSIFNSVLFVLLGLEALTIPFKASLIAVAVITIAITIAARLFSVIIVQGVLRLIKPVSCGSVAILTWGGLRGGVSVALALSAPVNPGRDPTITMTYAVVVFSILVQGLTFGPLTRWLGSGKASRHIDIEAAP